jgi:hypothetical protein
MKRTFDSVGARRRHLALTGAVLLALLLPACNDNTTNLPAIPRSIFVLEVEPNPIVGVQNTLTGSVSAVYVVRIRETAGLGATLNFVSSTVFDPATGLQVATRYLDSANLKVFQGSDRVEANEQLDVEQTTSYILTDFAVEAHLSVAIQALDDQGNLINQSILVPVVSPE